jgi:hypothetical protein
VCCFARTDLYVVLRYRSHLESRQLAPGTINLRLGAVRRLAYEAADCGLLSADLAAGVLISRLRTSPFKKYTLIVPSSRKDDSV